MSTAAANGSAAGTRPGLPAPPAVPDAYEDLRAAVLGEVSHSGVDLADGPAVAALVGKLVNTYQARAQAGLGGRALADPAAMKARLRRALVGYGPLGRFLSGEQVVEEVVIVGGDVAYIDSDGRRRGPGPTRGVRNADLARPA